MLLVETTLRVATPSELAERAALFMEGLAAFKEHRGAPLLVACTSKIKLNMDTSFTEKAANIATASIESVATIGWVDATPTDAAASTAAGEGHSVANVEEVAKFVVTAVEEGVVGGARKQRSAGGDTVAATIFLPYRVSNNKDVALEEQRGKGTKATIVQRDSEEKVATDQAGRKGAADAAAAAAAATPDACGGGGGGAAGSASDSTATIDVDVADNGDGTYSCSYTPPAGTDEIGAGKWQLEVLLNGKHIDGSPFPIEVRGSRNWLFSSMGAGGYVLSEGGTVATAIGYSWQLPAVIADGAGCTPMTRGIHYWELEVVKNQVFSENNPEGTDGAWSFGVCRPGISDEKWLMHQTNCTPRWELDCNTCKGTGLTCWPQPFILDEKELAEDGHFLSAPDDSSVGLLLDLDNGGTLTMYLNGKPCGTIAEGLVGPLLPCITSHHAGKAVRIHSVCALPFGALQPPGYVDSDSEYGVDEDDDSDIDGGGLAASLSEAGGDTYDGEIKSSKRSRAISGSDESSDEDCDEDGDGAQSTPKKRSKAAISRTISDDDDDE